MLSSRTTVSGSIVRGAIVLLIALTGFAYAQKAPRTFIASPEIYKVAKRGDQCVVIEATWASGQRDKFHSHTLGAIYWVTACKTRTFLPDGRSRDDVIRAGTYRVTEKPVLSHSEMNVGESECRAVLFERN